MTLQSKRVIFLAHRLATESAQGTSSPYQKAADAARDKLHRIQSTLLPQLYKEIDGEYEFWQFQRNITPGMEEYAEAVSYAHYLSEEKLITHATLLEWLQPDEMPAVRYNESHMRIIDDTMHRLYLCHTNSTSLGFPT